MAPPTPVDRLTAFLGGLTEPRNPTAPLVRRWLKLVVAHENGTCLIWKGPVVISFGSPYPQFCVGQRRRGAFAWLVEACFPEERDKLVEVDRSRGSYRLSYRTCAERLCVSPYCRTARPPTGWHGFKPGLTPEQVRAIRADPRPQRAIAPDYGVSHQHIGRIKRAERQRFS